MATTKDFLKKNVLGWDEKQDAYALERPYWVVTVVRKELWFYGAFEDDKSSACQEALSEIEDRILIINPDAL